MYKRNYLNLMTEDQIKILEQKITEVFKKKARNFGPGQNWVLNENNRVPEMLSGLAIEAIIEDIILKEKL